MTKKIVIALGGNAIQSQNATAAHQQASIRETMDRLKPLFEAEYPIVISHGNGPQIGNLLIQQSKSDSPQTPAMPLDTCGAMTQGMIGYWLETEVNRILSEIQSDKHVGTIITRVEVDRNDPRLHHPTKPIGPFYTETEMTQLKQSNPESVYKEDAGRGFRKVVPSPLPISILEHQMINTLVDSGNIVIACGGGGVPVVRQSHSFEGIEAVIDKDFASEKLAELIDADTLMILTNVEHVYINFNEPNQEKLSDITVDELQRYVEADKFAEGSMRPKVEAAIQFIGQNPNREVIITNLTNAYTAFEKHTGTHIHL
ncbi:carbamate kinase [Staphylococcus felis]|uniref:carbamate kinase n=1 Tax=Staphylococcus felis TaxID=46127 RepID=UPI00248060B0|nr:carbamate kinase [Staphylococcus felis]MDM8327155.1 carbamate kinase [Staphylococcus felis]MDQ7192319.1 carbamate kinase [Staphylococcus felis]